MKKVKKFYIDVENEEIILLNEEDFSGGINQYCKIEDIESNLIRCFED